MGVYLGPVAVFQRGHDAAAVGVIFGVRRRHHEHIYGQSHSVTLDLHIPLFHQVEQPHLDPFGQVGELVDTEDAPVGARHQAVVNHQFVGQITALGNLDGVDLTDKVGYGDIRGRKFFGVPFFSRDPFQGSLVAHLRDFVPADPADRFIGIVIDLAAGDLGDRFVQQVCQAPDDSGLGLPTLAQKDDVLSGQDGVLDLRNDCVLETDDARKDYLFGAYLGDQVVPHLFANGDNLVFALAESSDGLGTFRSGHAHPSIIYSNAHLQ